MGKIHLIVVLLFLSVLSLSALGNGESAIVLDAHSHNPEWVNAEFSHGHAMTAEYNELIKRLKEGNDRFIMSTSSGAGRDEARRSEVAIGQHPFAIILTCSDSRLPPEFIFDQGLGDLFVIRTAGNVVDDIAIGSIEYAAEHLHSKLIVVLGHERCGAVQVTVAGGEIPGHIGAIAEKIEPALAVAGDKAGDLVENTVYANIIGIVKSLQTSKPILAEMLHLGEIAVIGARYDLDGGHVSWLY